MKLSKAQVNSSNDLKVIVYWGDVLYNTIVVGPEKCLSVGNIPGNTIVLPADEHYDRDRLNLITVAKDNNSADLCFDENVQGRVYLGDEFLRLNAAIAAGKTKPLPDGTHQMLIANGDRAEFEIGHLTVLMEWVKDRKVIAKTLVADRRKSLLNIGMLVLAMLVCSLMLYFTVPPEEEKPERLVSIITRSPPVRAKASIGQKKTVDGGAKKGSLGKAKIAPKPKPPTEAEKLRRALSGDFVKDLAEIGTQSPIKAARKPDDAVNAALEQASTGGSSTKGFKTGAGGKSVGIGRMEGSGTGGFGGTGRLGLAGNSAVESGSGKGAYDTVWEGGLDRDVIDAIVRKKKDRIRLCYERQLNFKADLAGKVGIRFVISGQGKVMSASLGEDTMRSQAVNRCILAEVKTWLFPHPKGGTQVTVDYPFVFESSVKR